MKTAKIAELRDQLSRFLDYVRAGGKVIILDRDQPVAEIVPLGHLRTSESDAAVLDSLERKGIVRRGSGEIANSMLTGPLPGKKAGVLNSLLDERRKGR
jgi:antitoxin (DNA-binding transcriptional repressor) of toxin-antitoxin stability system